LLDLHRQGNIPGHRQHTGLQGRRDGNGFFKMPVPSSLAGPLLAQNAHVLSAAARIMVIGAAVLVGFRKRFLAQYFAPIEGSTVPAPATRVFSGWLDRFPRAARVGMTPRTIWREGKTLWVQLSTRADPPRTLFFFFLWFSRQPGHARRADTRDGSTMRRASVS